MDDCTNFTNKISKIRALSRPQLWSFNLTYGQSRGWLCSVQESMYVSVHVGTGDTWWKAMDEALLSLEKSREGEKT